MASDEETAGSLELCRYFTDQNASRIIQKTWLRLCYGNIVRILGRTLRTCTDNANVAENLYITKDSAGVREFK